jgi:uncharacterized protein (TIRG00374 family)
MKLRRILTIIGILGLAIVLLLDRGQLDKFIHVIRDLRWYVLVLVVLVQFTSYYMNALYYQSILRVFGYRIRATRLFEGALATNYVNYILPSAGMAGAGFLSQVLSPEVPRGEGVLAQFVRYAFSSLAVFLMLPVGFGLIILSHVHGGGSHTITETAILSFIGILLLAVIVIELIRRETPFRKLVKRTARLLHKRFKRFDEATVEHFVDEFYVGIHVMVKQRHHLVVPFMWSIFYIVVEMATFYLAFLAFGKTVNPGVAIMGYLLANIASVFGGALFSTGVFEFSMAGTLVALGVPLAFAVPVTLSYRTINLLIGLPPGFFYYNKYLPKG